MTFIALVLVGVANSIPVWLFGLAMVCDTILLIVAMNLGLLP